jgi:hypothetical protein
MKIIANIILLLALCGLRLSAQDCDIATTGLAVFNAANTAPISTIQVGQKANFKFSVANFGSDLGCAIPANTATATLNFTTVSGSISPIIYDGPASFVSGFFTWVYNSGTGILTGTNTTAIPNGTGDGGILIKVKGNAPGTTAGHLNLSQGGMNVPDNTANNSGSAQLIISVSTSNNNIICPGSAASFVAPVLAGNTYQWQADDGNGFVNINDGANYSGTTTAFLTLSGAPTSWYGYTYKCMITNGGTTYTNPLILKFSSTWTGAADTDWENPLNWGCSGLPDSNTDVFVNTGSIRYPKVNSNVSCRSLNLQTGCTIEVTPGKRIDVSGHD